MKSLMKFIAVMMVAMCVLGAVVSIFVQDEEVHPEKKVENQTVKTPNTPDIPDKLGNLKHHLKSLEENRKCEVPKVCLSHMNMFSENYIIILEHGTIEQIDESKQYAKEMSRLQKKKLPDMRDKFGPVLDDIFWEHDIDARTIGSGYRTVEFVGGLFAANRNIKNFQQNRDLRMVLHRMRFKRANYKWIPSARKFTYFEIESYDDGDIVYWERNDLNGALIE
jgi:hypothetical protein